LEKLPGRRSVAIIEVLSKIGNPPLSDPSRISMRSRSVGHSMLMIEPEKFVYRTDRPSS